jgi:protein-tyrosine phosphatase
MLPSGSSAASEQATNTDMTQKVLFLCTGNYYRSRFAEMLFNLRAPQANLDWIADSRGLELGISNVGPVYPLVLDRLKMLGFPRQNEPRFPARLETVDLESADLIIALNESEHKPLISQSFGEWADRTLYWDVPDLNLMRAIDAFSRIEEHIAALIQQLQNHQA